MKKFLVFIAGILVAALPTYAQNSTLRYTSFISALPVVYLTNQVTVHFISPEPIQYVDISTQNIAGDLPVKNILRIHHKADSLPVNDPKDAVLTIVGEKFIAQYRVVFQRELLASLVQSSIEIRPEDMRPLELAETTLSEPELRGVSYRLISKKVEDWLSCTKAFGIAAMVNKISSLGKYIFLDVSFKNTSALPYDIDQIRFTIDDKKITKATNVQSLEITPLFTLLDIRSFKKNYRNVFVFKKFTFPGNKVLRIELSENQLSGRVITQKVNYSNVLDADTVPEE